MPRRSRRIQGLKTISASFIFKLKLSQESFSYFSGSRPIAVNTANSIKECWERRILRWESCRYSKLAAINPFSWTIRARARLAEELLRRTVRHGDHLVELGCGSGILVRRILNLPFGSYLGIDLADPAVQMARITSVATGLDSRLEFHTADARELGEIRGDVVFFLGFTDWISEEELEDLLQRIQARSVILSYTDQTGRLLHLLYSTYQRLLRRWPHKCFPRSYSTSAFMAVVSHSGWRVTESVRRPSLGPGRILVLARDSTSNR